VLVQSIIGDFDVTGVVTLVTSQEELWRLAP
jgi:hypothetical protein